MIEKKSIIDQYITTSIKEKNTYMIEAFRSIKAKMLLDITSKKPRFLQDEERFKGMIQFELKERKESNSFITDHQSDDWIKNNTIINNLAEFLPKKLSEADQIDLIEKIIANNNFNSTQDVGKVMAQLKDRKDELDMKFISGKVKELLQ